MVEDAPTSETPLLELIGIEKTFNAVDDGPSTTVLRDVSLDVGEGESIAIIGPSGSGKSTLLNIIGGLDRPTAGTVRIDGKDVCQRTDADLARLRNRTVGFVFQSHHLLPQCTALENVLLPSIVLPDETMRREAPNRARSLLDRLGLAGRMSNRPGQLSGGERQRVAVARALINRPRLILADEPTGSLDEEAAEQLTEMLIELHREQRVTLITVTHAMTLAGRMERGFALRRGRLEPWSDDA